MNIQKFKEILIERERIAKETRDEWDYGIEKCQQELVDVLSEDIISTVKFLNTECTAEQFVWISEIFDEIVEETQCREFIDVLYEVAKKYPKETEEYNIMYFIETSKDFLKD